MGIMMICDRCTKPITGDLDDRTTNKLTIRKDANPKTKPLAKADLCDACVEAVKDFIFDYKEGCDAPDENAGRVPAHGGATKPVP